MIGPCLCALTALLIAGANGRDAGSVRRGAPADSLVTRSVETVKVADGVYAFIAPESFGGLVSGNSLVVIGDSAVLVVDAGHFPSVTRNMIATIRTLTTRPVRYLVNTHWHPDHWVGNAEYQRAFPGITIISTSVTRDEIVRQGPSYLSNYQDTTTLHQLRDLVSGSGATAQPADMRAYYAATIPDLADAIPGWRGARLVAPTVTFEQNLTVHLGGRDARVLFLGRGNTEGDAVVLVPDVKVVATGDLVVSPTPYAYDSFLGEWIGALHAIEAMSPAALVPGHGPVQHDLQYVHQLIDLLTYVHDRAADAVKQGLTLPEARKLADLEPYRQRFAGSDPRRRVLFDIGFARPGVKGAYDRLKAEAERAKGKSPLH